MSQEILQQKAQVVDEFAQKVKDAKSFVFLDYRGLTVSEDTAMRSALRAAGVEYKVVKNRLILRSLQKQGIRGFDECLNGPTAIAISYDDPVAPSKVLVDSAKKYNNKIAVKAGLVEGKFVDENGVKSVAAIPAKPQLIAQLLGMLQHPIRGLAVALSEIAKKKEA
jgi:large subunit ribosomal protein L10